MRALPSKAVLVVSVQLIEMFQRRNAWKYFIIAIKYKLADHLKIYFPLDHNQILWNLEQDSDAEI